MFFEIPALQCSTPILYLCLTEYLVPDNYRCCLVIMGSPSCRQVDSAINEAETDGQTDDQVRNRTFYVFRWYFIHFAIRVLCGALFTILQHTLLFPGDFDFKFGCSLRPTELPKNTSVSQLNSTFVTSVRCENAKATEKHTLWLIVSVLNALFAFIIFAEIIRLC